MLPYAYVTNSSGPFETVTTGDVASDVILILEHTFNYDITVVVLEKDARVAENSLDDFQKLILQTIEVDHNLTGVGSASVDSCVPLRIDKLRAGGGDEGRGIKGRVLTIRCKKVTS